MVTDTVRRVAIHLPRQQLSADLVLPAGCPVALLLPALVDGVLGDGLHAPDPVRWHLSLPAGPPLDPTKNLRDNGIRDGDLVLLTDEPVPPPRLRTGGTTGAIIAGGRDAPSPAGGAEIEVALIVLVALAAALGWTGWITGHGSALWVSSAIAVTAAVAAVGGWAAAPLSDALGVGAVCHTAVAGALAATGLPGAVVATFAAAAATAMAVCLSLLLRRRGFGASPTLSGCAAAGGAGMIAGVVGAVSATGVGAIGAVLTGASLATLGAAASLAMAVTGIGPTRRVVGPQRAQAAHRLLTGLTAGWSATAVVGVALVAADVDESRVAAGTFAAVVGVVLTLRHRVHADPVRRRIVSGAGLAALMIALAVAVTASPGTAPWWCSGVSVAGATLVFARLRPPNPLMHSVIRGVDYAAVGAVVPLAAWLVGVYDAVRAVNLP